MTLSAFTSSCQGLDNYNRSWTFEVEDRDDDLKPFGSVAPPQ